MVTTIISSTFGTVLFLIGILSLVSGAIIEYLVISDAFFFYGTGVVLLFAGLYVIFKSYGGRVFLPESLEMKILKAYSLGIPFYEPDNHNIIKAKRYGRILFEQHAQEFLYIYSGRLAVNFYEDMYPIIKKISDQGTDVQIVLEERPENINLAKRYINEGIPVYSYGGSKQWPHFFVTETAYRLETDYTPFTPKKGHGIGGITHGYFVFDANKQRIAKLKEIFRKIYQEAKEIS